MQETIIISERCPCHHRLSTPDPSATLDWLTSSASRHLPHHVQIYVSNLHTRSEQTVDGFPRRTLPISQWPGDDTYDHLKFALRYEGLHLGIFRAVLPRLDPTALAASIREEPTSAYARRIWFLDENLTDSRLDLPDLTMGNYVPLADPGEYYTGPIRRSARHRVALNLLVDWLLPNAQYGKGFPRSLSPCTMGA